MKISPRAGTAAGIIAAAIAALLLTPTITGATDSPQPPSTPLPTLSAETLPSTVPDVVDHTPESGTLTLLEQLPPVSAPPGQDYDRDEFGQRWADIDRNGCDTRNDMLGRDLIEATFKPGTHDCVVLTGILHDPYTGETVDFTRLSEGYQPVQVDHVIPLAAAWDAGASGWTSEQRTQFANDPANLQVTTANQSKGSRGPASWMPPAADYACEYATRYVELAHHYDLALPEEDRAALRGTLTGCSQ